MIGVVGHKRFVVLNSELQSKDDSELKIVAKKCIHDYYSSFVGSTLFLSKATICHTLT